MSPSEQSTNKFIIGVFFVVCKLESNEQQPPFHGQIYSLSSWKSLEQTAHNVFMECGRRALRVLVFT